MSAYADHKHSKPDHDRGRDEHGVHPEERLRSAVPVLTRPRSIVIHDRLREARPDHDIEHARNDQEPGTRLGDHHLIPSQEIR